MKKWIFAIAIILCSIGLEAQDAPKARFRHHRIFFGGSVYNMDHAKLLSFRNDTMTLDRQGAASFMLGYEYKVNKRLSFATEGYFSFAGTSFKDSEKGTYWDAYLNSSYQLKTRYSWLYRPVGKGFFRMYSGVGLGVYQTFTISDDIEVDNSGFMSETRFGYQVDAVGAEISFSWFGFWLEGGYGDQGNAKVGISFNFKK